MEDKRQTLIRLFTFERPYALKYRRQSAAHKQDKPELKKMIAEGMIEVEALDRTWVTYRYITGSVATEGA